VGVDYGGLTIVDDLRTLELTAPGAVAAAVYDRPIHLRQLYDDPESGEEHYLVRYPPGVKCKLHRHTSAHTIVVLDGRLEANGRIVGPGGYAHFRGREPMRHQPARAGGCLFVLLFHGPFDVEILDTE
jgi:hypothetical protein